MFHALLHILILSTTLLALLFLGDRRRVLSEEPVARISRMKPHFDRALLETLVLFSARARVSTFLLIVASLLQVLHLTGSAESPPAATWPLIILLGVVLLGVTWVAVVIMADRLAGAVEALCVTEQDEKCRRG